MTLGPDKELSLRFYGPFHALTADGRELRLRNKKAKAMLALLAHAPDGRRTRKHLQAMLWPLAYDESRASGSFRQCLSQLRKALGPLHTRICDETDQDCLRLRLDKVALIGSPSDGPFLEGLDLPDVGEFEEWLRVERRRAEQTFEKPAATPAPPAAVASFATQALARSAHAEPRLRPTIAILPFYPIADDQQVAFLGEMLAEEDSRVVTRSQYANIISHFSCRAVDVRRIILQEIRSKLNVDYVVYGAVRLADGRFRLDADLVDANQGVQVQSWSLTGALVDFYAGECPVVGGLARHVANAVIGASFERISGRPFPDVASHDLFMTAVALLHKQDIVSSARARQHFEELERRAPWNSHVQSWLALWYTLCLSQGWHEDGARDRMKACDAAAKALDVNPSCPFSLAVDGIVQSNLLKNFEEADRRFEAALALDPSNAYGWLFSGVTKAFRGDGASAVAATERSRFLTPLDPGAYLFETLSATASLAAENYEEALRLANSSRRRNPFHNSTLRVRTIALHELGRIEEAREAGGDLMTRERGLTVDGYLRSHPAAEFATGRRWARALLGAGVPQSGGA